MTDNLKSYVEQWQDETKRLSETGMYSHADERDACGVGLIASLDGQPRRSVVAAGITALKALWHRGAVDADGKTGDGAGIHVQIPQDFFREHVRRSGFEPGEGKLGLGMVFLPKPTLQHKRPAAPSSRPRSWISATASMAGARCRWTPPSSAKRPMRRGPRSSRC
jgi:glutamate synthase domain-containing protein 1